MEKKISDDGSELINSNKEDLVKLQIDKCKHCHFLGCACESKELIKNGGFEMLSADGTQVFAEWRTLNQVSNTTVSQGPPGDMPPVTYEGIRAAWFISNTSATLEQHSISLQQNVTVTPGCIYQFSFAENFFARGEIAEFTPSLTGRVFFTDSAGSQFDLIKITIEKGNDPSNINLGYSFHQKTAEMPVPCNVSKVTVQFDFFVRDTGGTMWLLDGVSLRAVSAESLCSKKGCVSFMNICKPGNLIRNGSFEDIFGGPGSPFLYWRQLPDSSDQVIVQANSNVEYEEVFVASFTSVTSGTAQAKSVSLRQIVPVTPGCLLELSFAENFLNRGDPASNIPRLIARVFWVNDIGNEFNLISIPIVKSLAPENRGYTFHKKRADIPIPCNVTNVYVQFDFSTTDTGNTQWLLDAVQLHALPWASTCCQDL
ncbi:MAG: hypothetical protein ACOX15_01745 [Tepidanaerobacteraceae bacterium]